MDINEIIGINLKKYREVQNLSLGQLAELSGVSKVMLSQIEKGTGNPTINTIWKIAAGLKITYSALLESPGQDIEVIRRTDISAQEDNGYKIICYCPTTPKRNFELYKIEMQPGCKHESIGHSEQSQEYILVTAGELTIQIGDQEHTLAKDDAVTFDASGRHVYENRSDTMAEMTLIIYYNG